MLDDFGAYHLITQERNAYRWSDSQSEASDFGVVGDYVLYSSAQACTQDVPSYMDLGTGCVSAQFVGNVFAHLFSLTKMPS